VLWAITSYFNPARYRRRLENFQEFRRRLAVPLLAVELGYGDRFELGDDDADILVRLRGRDVLWQKERLLNVALGRLPDECTAVASLDCDVIFGREDWAAAARALLERFSAVQLFARVHYLRRDWVPGRALREAEDFAQESSASAIGRGSDPASALASVFQRDAGVVAPGFGWAFRREVVERHGFYDACIVGGGDNAMACAAFGCPEAVVGVQVMNPAQQTRYRAWASPFHRSVAGQVGCLDGDLFHLWHGRLEDRGTRQRHLGLGQFRFDPRHDIALDDAGCWRWSSDKPDLHAYVRQYFATRREDG
jgi:hypothetical protein